MGGEREGGWEEGEGEEGIVRNENNTEVNERKEERIN